MGAPRMTTQTLTVLSTMLSDPDADWYGLELCKRSRLKPGTVYPVLDRLLKAEWVERRWEDIDPKIEGRPRRRLYRLTGVGAPRRPPGARRAPRVAAAPPCGELAAVASAEARMSVLLVILGFVGALVVLVVRSLAVDEIKGRVQRRISASVEATIASLPDELQSEWAEEWRAELAAVTAMPLSAAQFARGLRRSARELVAEPALAPVGIREQAPQSPTRRYVRWRFGGQGARSLTRFSVQLSGALQRLKRLAGANGGGAIRATCDVISASLVLLLLAPLLATIALALKATSRGPVLVHQRGVGRDNRGFRRWKFRTLVEGVEETKCFPAHLNKLGEEPMFKIRHYPRVTRVGRLLRRTSLDELPQLWNVLRGEMSFVGPRPRRPAL